MKNIIQNLYQTDEIVSISKVEHGVSSNNSIIQTSGEKYFLRSYSKNDYEKISIRHKAIDFFKKNGIPVVAPIKNIKGETLFTVNDAIYVIFPYVSGIKVPHDKASVPQAEELGKTLAKMHKLSENGYPEEFEILLKIRKPRSKALKEVNQVRDVINLKANKDSFDLEVEQLLELKEAALKNETNYHDENVLKQDTLVHGDLHSENVFFDENDKISHIIDLDDIEVNYREAEILWAILISFWEDSYEQNTTQVNAFTEGYNSVYKIDKPRLKLAFYINFEKLMTSMWTEKQYYLHNNERVKFIIENDIRRIKYLKNNLDKVLDVLRV